MARRLADDIIEGLEEAVAFEGGRITLTARTVRLPAPKPVSPTEAASILGALPRQTELRRQAPHE